MSAPGRCAGPTPQGPRTLRGRSCRALRSLIGSTPVRPAVRCRSAAPPRRCRPHPMNAPRAGVVELEQERNGIGRWCSRSLQRLRVRRNGARCSPSQLVTLRYDPDAPPARPIAVVNDAKPAGTATRLDAYANTSVKRHRPSGHLHCSTPAARPKRGSSTTSNSGASASSAARSTQGKPPCADTSPQSCIPGATASATSP